MGMTLGILLGNVESMSTWIFSATAGIFLYVALVDMVSLSLLLRLLTRPELAHS